MTIKWDENNKPMGYILGASPGFSANELTNMGFARKLAKAARMGFEFAMLDFEQLGEELEPYIEEQIRWVRDAQKIEFGMHLDYRMDLTLADAFLWRYMQEQLRRGATAAKKFGAKFILFHTSSHIRPSITAIFGRGEGLQKLVGPDGTNLGDWIQKNNLKEWFIAKFIKIMFSAMGVASNPVVINYFESRESFKDGYEEMENALKSAQKSIDQDIGAKQKEIESLIKKKDKTPEDETRIIILQNEIANMRTSEYFWRLLESMYGEMAYKYQDVYSYIRNKKLIYELFDYWKNQGSVAEEYVAYLTVAKKMQRDGDALWKTLVRSNEDPYAMARKANELLGKEAKYPEEAKRIVTAVAAKYIEGHLFSSNEQYAVYCGVKGKEKLFKSVYNFCAENKIQIFIETAMPEKGAEGELRIMSLLDHINIVKAIDKGRFMSYCIDFEHLLTNLIDPIEEAERLRKQQPGDGKYISILHVNAPRPIMGAHAPIEPLSLDSFVIYKWLYSLRQAGMRNSYLIWEMGSHGVRQSAIAFRNMVKELEKDPPTEPNKLKPEFFGIDEEMRARQMLAIRQHAFDPIKGLMVVPEEEWTMLGETARRRGKIAEWERRKYR